MTSMARSPQEGKSAWFGGLGVEILISSQQTGGVFSLVELTLEPGRLVWPHVHTRENEYTYVLKGEIGLRIGDQIIEAAAGCPVVKPRGIPHTLWNAGPQPARTLESLAPGGETSFLELAEIFRIGAFEQVETVAARYGLTRLMDWVPELTTRYQLKLLGQ